ncbi:hypothetical protein KI387_037514, partial [Taxus chinensis]
RSNNEMPFTGAMSSPFLCHMDFSFLFGTRRPQEGRGIFSRIDVLDENGSIKEEIIDEVIITRSSNSQLHSNSQNSFHEEQAKASCDEAREESGETKNPCLEDHKKGAVVEMKGIHIDISVDSVTKVMGLPATGREVYKPKKEASDKLNLFLRGNENLTPHFVGYLRLSLPNPFDDV